MTQLAVPSRTGETKCFIGGEPIWFGEPPTEDFMTCQHCNSRDHVLFICQIEASYEENKERYLYLFLCFKETCMRTSEGWILLRGIVFGSVQNTVFGQQNQWEDWDDLYDNQNDWTQSADILDKDTYTDKEEVVELLKRFRISSLQKNSIAELSSTVEEKRPMTDGSRKLKLPKIPLTIVEEQLFKGFVKTDSEINSKIREYYATVGKEEKDLGNEENFSFAEMQKEEWKYYKALEVCPEQCIRYNYAGEPLIPPWIRLPHGKDWDSELACCITCGSRRVFEFQLMSQFLYFLKNKSSLENETLSFNEDDLFMSLSTIIAFTCAQDCANVNNRNSFRTTCYSREFVVPIFERTNVMSFLHS